MPNLTIRNIDPDILARFNRAAGARQMTQREYLAALVELHHRMRGLADGGDEDCNANLVDLNLQTITG